MDEGPVKKILFWLYRFPRLRRTVLSLARRLGENEFRSLWLRRVFKHYHQCEVGIFSYGCFTQRLPKGTTIGKFCSFADDVEIIPGDHKIESVTTHPFIYNPEVGVVDKFLREDTPLVIGNDVWLGHRVTILGKTARIGDGAVIAAGAVVTKEVPPYAVVAGVPARVIKYRFDPDTIRQLLSIRWWDWPLEKIRADHRLFNDVRNFCETRAVSNS